MKKKKILLLLIGLVLSSLFLTACGSLSSSKSGFPTGKFVLSDSEGSEGIYFNEDGTWVDLYYGADICALAKGTYSVKGDLYIEASNDQNCGKSPMSFKYKFDGANLHFELTDESKNDTCANRRQSFDGVTYVLSK